MRGFSKHLASEFTDYNIQATQRIITATGDYTITNYTYSLPDVDLDYCWVREEEIFTNIMTPQEIQIIVPQAVALSQGMVINAGEP